MLTSLFSVIGFFRATPVLLLLLSGCSSELTSRLSIVGGIESPNNSPAWSSTVAIGKVIRNQDAIEWSCSGTLVSEDLIVTAAHCLYDVKSPSELRVLFGNGTNSPESVISEVESFKSFREEGYRYFPNFDVAWIKLTGLAPNSSRPAKVLTDWEQLESFVGVPLAVKLAGFGQAATKCPNGSTDCTGIKREVNSTLRNAVDTSHFISQMVLGPTPGYGSCFGDSGGPAYVYLENEWYLAGVLSGKSPLMNTKEVLKSGSICESGESIYNFIGPYVNWIWSISGSPIGSLSDRQASKPSNIVDSQYMDLHELIDEQDFRKSSWDTIAIMIQHFKKNLPADNDGSFFLDTKRIAASIQSWTDFAYNGIYFNPSSQKLRSYQIADVSPLKYLKSAKSLTLVGNRIIDTTPLGELAQLESLTLGNNVDHDSKQRIPWRLEFLDKLTQLKSLSLANNKLGFDQNAIPWSSLSSLEVLDLSGNVGIDLSLIPWADLQNLRELNLSKCGLTSVLDLLDARSLVKLNLSQNQISNLEPISKLSHLEELDITKNPISDFNSVTGMHNLKAIKHDQDR